MPKPTKGARLGGSPSHERIILANLASQLFEHGRITTTQTRAHRVQPVAERLISKAKRGDLHSRRLVKKTITNPDIVHLLFTEIAPKMDGRDGGYTRITKVGHRKGDNAPMVVIELVTEPIKKSERKKPAAPKAETEQLADSPATELAEVVEVVEVEPIEAEVVEVEAVEQVTEGDAAKA